MAKSVVTFFQNGYLINYTVCNPLNRRVAGGKIDLRKIPGLDIRMPSENTLSLYKKNYDRLVAGLGKSVFTAKEAVAYLLTKYPNPGTRNTYLSALKHFAKTDEERLVYLEQTKKDVPLIQAKEEAQKLPETKQENLLTWEEVQKTYEEAVKQHNAGMLSLQYLLIVALYSLTTPVRLDYANMIYVRHKSLGTIPFEETELEGNVAYEPQIEDKKENYCWLGKSPRFIFNAYKTAGKYHQVTLPIPDRLHKLLRTHAEQWNRNSTEQPKYVFLGTPNALGKALSRTFMLLSKKSVTVNLLRHARVDFFYRNTSNPSIKQKKELAEQMLHSYTEQERYRTEVEQLSQN